MSLLMDALRRAEADKKAQEERAARAAGGDAGNDGGVITRMSPYSNSQDDTVQIDGRALQAAAATMADFDLRIDDNLDRSVSMTLPDGMTLEPLEGPAAASGNDTDFLPMGSDDDDFDATEFTANATFGGRAERREQTATLPNARGMSSDLDDYFDRSHATETPRSVPRIEDGTLEDLATHTVVGAQTVFRAGERARGGRLLTWIAGIAACAVLGIAALGVYYANLSPAPHVVPSPEVARDVEKSAPDQRELVPLVNPSPSTVDALARIDTKAQDLPPSEPPPPVKPPAQAPQATQMPATTPRVTDRNNVAPTTERPRAASYGAPLVPRTAPPSVATRNQERPETRPLSEEINSGEVQISRTPQPNRTDAVLNKAYAAFQAGDLDTAAKLYNGARSADPDRRDTLLGLGAVALKRGDLPRAYDYYASVLKRHPDDPVARAALFNMTEAEGEGGAARLRLLLDGHADAAYIHAALGNWYARRQRWADAQQAYFDAARLDGGHPDYAFNLAVSLEHLGQGVAALGYYQKSLSLRAQRGASFNTNTAEQRIAALSAPNTRAAPAP
jgi:tetratricopeptide (TPR) repeat protein